ncbi:MAG: hypothetical protein AB1606_04575 [Nitrospirota bacterium]
MRKLRRHSGYMFRDGAGVFPADILYLIPIAEKEGETSGTRENARGD